MKDDVTMQRRLSLAERMHKMTPAAPRGILVMLLARLRRTGECFGMYCNHANLAYDNN